jgi:Spy/CpxP family protein refolding chaperone
MRSRLQTLMLIGLLAQMPAWSQVATTNQASGAATVTTNGGRTMIYHREMGKWWQDSEVVKKLQLSDKQVSQLDQIFYQHRLKLIDDTAAMEKEDLKLQNLLDADTPDEGQVNSQVDQVLSARGEVEREYTAMNLDTRKVLSVQQWRQLKSIRGDLNMPGNKVFIQKVVPGGPLPPPPPDELPPLPPAPPQEMD